MSARFGALLLLMSAGMPPASAASAAYQLDPVHTRVLFAVEHAGFSSALGTVSGSTGQLQFDPDDWSTAKLEVSVPLQRFDLGDEKWNQAVRAGNLLDTARFPTVTFISTRIEPIDSRHASVYGTLTLHGVSNEVKLDVTLNALKRHPLPPFRRTAGFSATATLSRADFGIDAWKSVIGDRVELRLEVEATRTRNGGADEATDSNDNGPEPTPTTEPSTEPTTP
ncbi:MAG: YceI family protein [Pseudoxanthomonas sp.]